MDAQKRDDALLDWGAQMMRERDQAREELAAEKVAHRVTRKELAEVTGMVLK